MRSYGLLVLRRAAFSSSTKGNGVGLSPPSPSFSNNDHVFSVAPMMDYTDVFQRTFFRYLSARCVLYTEMVTANALANAPEKVGLFLRSDMAIEEPLVLQLGGNEPSSMGLAARLASHQYGYRQININAGCPSDRVSGDGCFGAKLMLSPRLVADIAQEINNQTIDKVTCPVTVKCRIGVNDDFSHEDLLNFIRVVSEQGGVTHFIMHARRAILNANFSPKDNRTIPPLKYDVVYSLAKEFPNLQFTINGGVETLVQAKEHHSQGILGVMVGRQAIKSPYYWRNVDSIFYNAVDPGNTRREILVKYANYLRELEKANPGQLDNIKSTVVKPVLNLFHGEPNSKDFKRFLTEGVVSKRVDKGQIKTKTTSTLYDLLMKSTEIINSDILDSRL